MARQPGVDPSQVHRTQVGATEVRLLDEPLPRDLRGVDVGREEDLEQGGVTLVLAIGDRRLVAADLCARVSEFDHLESLAGVGDCRRPAPRALVDLHRRTAELHVDAVPARGAEHPRSDRLAVHAKVDRVNGDLPPAGVERGAGRELADGLGSPALEPHVFGLERATVRVDPAQPDVQGHGVVEQRVVRQDPVLLEHADPVLAAQVTKLPRGELAGRLGRAPCPLVVVSGGRGLGLLLKLGQDGVDRAQAVLEGLNGGLPAVTSGVQVRGEGTASGAGSRDHPGSQTVQGRVADAIEGRDEACEVLLDVGLGQLDEVPEEGTRFGGADSAGGLARVGAARVAGRRVDQVGGVLPAQDLLGLEVGGWRAHLAVDDRQRVAELGQVLAATGDVREAQGIARQTSSTTDTLEVGRDSPRQRREEHRREIPDVDTHLQGGRRDEHVGSLRVIVGAPESVLIRQPGHVIEQAGVLARDHAAHVRRGIQTAVEPIGNRLRRKVPRAPHGKAGSSVKLGDDR
ncbi:hypothetical protein GALL_284910 [mine drainage metagenome]|uniref:Uncharacterized protein n=1 Tax=mine drainage metagenome TaxID=410659 RepID=A0A1J5RBV9_9ZZZZ